MTQPRARRRSQAASTASAPPSPPVSTAANPGDRVAPARPVAGEEHSHRRRPGRDRQVHRSAVVRRREFRAWRRSPASASRSVDGARVTPGPACSTTARATASSPGPHTTSTPRPRATRPRATAAVGGGPAPVGHPGAGVLECERPGSQPGAAPDLRGRDRIAAERRGGLESAREEAEGPEQLELRLHLPGVGRLVHHRVGEEPRAVAARVADDGPPAGEPGEEDGGQRIGGPVPRLDDHVVAGGAEGAEERKQAPGSPEEETLLEGDDPPDEAGHHRGLARRGEEVISAAGSPTSSARRRGVVVDRFPTRSSVRTTRTRRMEGSAGMGPSGAGQREGRPARRPNRRPRPGAGCPGRRARSRRQSRGRAGRASAPCRRRTGRTGARGRARRGRRGSRAGAGSAGGTRRASGGNATGTSGRRIGSARGRPLRHTGRACSRLRRRPGSRRGRNGREGPRCVRPRRPWGGRSSRRSAPGRGGRGGRAGRATSRRNRYSRPSRWRKSIRLPAAAPGPSTAARIAAASSGVGRSSASRFRTQSPLALAEGKGLLLAESRPGPLHHPRARRPGQRHRAIGGAGVDDQNTSAIAHTVRGDRAGRPPRRGSGW